MSSKMLVATSYNYLFLLNLIRLLSRALKSLEAFEAEERSWEGASEEGEDLKGEVEAGGMTEVQDSQTLIQLCSSGDVQAAMLSSNTK